MKKLFQLLLLLVLNHANAQNYNLISNSSFEFVPGLSNTSFHVVDTTLPNGQCWARANSFPMTFRGSSYIHNDTREFKARTGNFGAAFLCETPSYDRVHNVMFDTIVNGLTYVRNYIQTYLSKPLQAGKQYYLNLYIGDLHFSSSDHYWLHPGTVRNIGAYFSTTQLKDFSNLSRINVTPQINFTNWSPAKTDTFDYIKLSAVYTATGGEQYLTLGNFDYFANFYIREVDTGSISPTGDTISPFGAITYLDDISLVEDTTQPILSLDHFSLGKDTIICPKDTFTLGGEPYFFHYWWNTGDTTRFIKITQPGTYWCTVDYGCSVYTDTIHIHAPLNVTFDIKDTAICNVNYVAHPPKGYTSYLWNDHSTADSLHITAPGTYWLTVTNACGQSYTDTFTVTIADTTKPPPPLPDIYLLHKAAIIRSRGNGALRVECPMYTTGKIRLLSATM